MTNLSPFAHTILEQKYAQTKEDGTKETWDDVAERVAKDVLGSVFPEDVAAMTKLIRERKFMPGGRYLYAAGRDFKAFNNCFLLRAVDSREGWAKLMYDATHCLMSGGGIGVNYSDVRPNGAVVGGLGGICTGPLALMEAVNETARQIQAGGSRRSAVYASLHWWHPDVFDFIRMKDWDEATVAAKADNFNARAPMDMTNISVALDDHFFNIMEGREGSYTHTWDGGTKHTVDKAHAQEVYAALAHNMLKTGEPGIQIDTGKNAGEVLRNACLPGFATLVCRRRGLVTMDEVSVGDEVWSEDGWVTVQRKFDNGVRAVTAARTSGGTVFATDDHLVVQRGKKVELRDATGIDPLRSPEAGVLALDPQRIMDGLYFGDGYPHKASNGAPFLCIGVKDQDYFSSEIAHLIGSPMDVQSYRVTISSDATFNGSVTDRVIPDAITQGSLLDKASWLRGFFTANGSVTKGVRVSLKSTNQDAIVAIQEMLWEFGIMSYLTFNKSSTITWSNGTYTGKPSVDLNINDSESLERFKLHIGFIQAYKMETLDQVEGAKRSNPRKIIDRIDLGEMPVYDITVSGPSHTYWANGHNVSNCTEVTSSDNLDVCNLGSLNLAQFDDLNDFTEAVEVATRFLLAGTVVGHVPNGEVESIRTKNRRLGLGLMGLYDWLVARGYQYGPNEELEQWLAEYEHGSRHAANVGADLLGVSRPVKVRAIAPTGTIGILAETTSGIEPLFATAYKRRYLKGTTWHFQYVVDAGAKRLQDQYGINPDDLETAYDLAYDPERRIAFQAWVQRYVDHGISSTLNLPSVDEHAIDSSDFAAMLYKYLPNLRGITAYPDGARGGQPLTVVPFTEASESEGLEFEEYGATNACVGGVCGI